MVRHHIGPKFNLHHLRKIPKGLGIVKLTPKSGITVGTTCQAPNNLNFLVVVTASMHKVNAHNKEACIH